MEIKTIHIVLEKVRPIMVKKDTPEFINTFRKVYETINHDFFIEKGSTETDDLIIYNEFVKQVEKEVENLPQKMRDIFQMSRNDGLSHKEIAEKLDITEHGVKKSINRALKLLKIKFNPLFLLFF